MVSIKKVFTVFELDEAVYGFSNSGIEHSEHSFTLSRYYKGCFDSEKKCEQYIEETLIDCKKRGVAENQRFVILPVYCCEDDKDFY